MPPCSSSFSISTPFSVGLPLPAFSPSTISAVFHLSPLTISFSCLSFLSTPTQSKLSTPLNRRIEDLTTPPGAINISIPLPDKKIVGAKKVAAESVLKDIGTQLKSIYKIECTDIIPKVPGSNLKNRLTNVEQVKKLRKLH